MPTPARARARAHRDTDVCDKNGCTFNPPTRTSSARASAATAAPFGAVAAGAHRHLAT